MLSIVGQEVGFFKNLHSQFCKHFSETDLSVFSGLTNDYERFVFVYNKIHANCGSIDFQDYLEILNAKPLKQYNKSLEISNQLKQEGNKAFQANLYKESFQKYSKAILKCPQVNQQNWEELAILFANRSAALYHLHEYKNAMLDIESALKYKYPTELRYKVCDRKARCLLALKQHRLAIEGFRTTLTALDDAKLPLERKQKWQTDVQIMLAMLSKNADQLRDEPLISKDVMDCTELSRKASRIHPAVIESINFNKSQTGGRFAEATETIKAGDIIVVEKPHCAVLLEEYTISHCFNCLVRMELSYPCPSCCAVSFCSIKCRDIAMASHHGVECCVLPTLWSSGMSITCLIALRIISQKSMEYFNQIKSYLNKLDGAKDLGKSFGSYDYQSVYNLERNEQHRSPEDLLQRTHMAVFLFRTLKSTHYFKNQDELLTNGSLTTLGHSKKLTNDEVYIGGLILRNLQFLQFNAHEISELQFVRNDPDQSKSMFIGGAVYPTLSLFNHSCNPGFVRYFKGTTVVCQAIRATYPGEMVAENYGPMFTVTAKEEREKTLKTQYWFDCDCLACEENWPKFEDMDESKLRFKCLTEGCKNTLLVPVDTMKFMALCPTCNEHTNLFKGLKDLQDTDAIFRVARVVMKTGDTTRALTKFIELLRMLEETLTPPFKDFHLCQQASRTCMLALGNKHVIMADNKDA